MATMELWEKPIMVVLSIEDKELSIEIVPVVWDFIKVFPEDLLRLPPEREVEFKIDVMFGINPISKDPYRMAPIELQELSNQVEEMLKKGFTQPSVSP